MRLAFALCFVPALALALIACEPWPKVQFVNETGDEVLVYEGGQLAHTLQPGETVEQDTTRDDWNPAIHVTTRDGTILLDETITYNDLGNRDFKIVIVRPQ